MIRILALFPCSILVFSSPFAFELHARIKKINVHQFREKLVNDVASCFLNYDSRSQQIMLTSQYFMLNIMHNVVTSDELSHKENTTKKINFLVSSNESQNMFFQMKIASHLRSYRATLQ